MIVTKLQGGLGNQLFQWASTESASIDNNTDSYYEINYFQNNLPTNWKFELDKFNININTATSIPQTMIIDDFHYKPIQDNCYLNGYWQSEKYFINNESHIRNSLKIDPIYKTNILNKYPILNEPTVSMHIRRGDYVNLKDIHLLQTVDHYKNGYDIINNPNINVVILSDDIQWCKDNLHFNNTHYIDGNSNVTDLRIISLCDHNIMANSSFSWWGCLVERNPK